MSALAPLLQDLSGLVSRHLVSGLAVAARLLPVVFLCPLLGGRAAPPSVRLAVAAALGAFCVGPLGLALPAGGSAEAWLPVVALETVFGFALALAASLPFDAARMGGRFVDLFQGSASEAASLHSGGRESASGELLHTGLVALAVDALGAGALARGLSHSFALVPLGAFRPAESFGLDAAALLGAAFAAALAVAAPAAAVSFGVEASLALAARAAARLGLVEQAAAVRVLAGSAVLWLALTPSFDRLLADVLALPLALAGVAGVLR